MTELRKIGDRSRFAFEIGPPDPTHSSRRMDIWAAGKCITYRDNSVYVFHVAGEILNVIRSFLGVEDWARPFRDLSAVENHLRLQAEEEYSRCRILDWGPTTDDVYAHLFCENGLVQITFAFHREDYPVPEDIGKVFVAELLETEFLGVLLEGHWLLANGRA